MRVIANAKINLSLNVKCRRADGYHELVSLMAPLSFGDELVIEECSEPTYLTSNDNTIPLGEENLVMKAYRFMQERYGLTQQYHIHIQKEVPSQAGLGGGSSDAGALIRFLWNNEEDLSKLAKDSVVIGADLPFCVMNQPMRVAGIGELTEFVSLPNLKDYYVLLVKPSVGISTKVAYETLNLEVCDHPDVDGIIKAMQEGKAWTLGNSLESSAFALASEIKQIKNRLKELGFEHSLMSGSGSCVFALTKEIAILEKGFTFFNENVEFVKKTRIICE